MPNPFFMVFFLFLIMLALKPDSDAGIATGGSADDRARMQELTERWFDAYRAGDLDALMAIMHDDAVVMPAGQPTVRGEQAVRDYFASRIGRPGVSLDGELGEIRINGDWAFVRGRFSLTVGGGGDEAPREHHGRYLVLYEKVGGEWKMLRDIDNAAPPPVD